MKRKLTLTLILLLILPFLVCSAQSQPYSYEYDKPLPLKMEFLDKPAGDSAHLDSYIVRMTAPNGQDIYFVSYFENPRAFAVDANFDGVSDLAVMVSSGATNSVFRLFVNLNGQYVRVADGMEEGLFNPQFFPEQKLVLSSGTSGMAGALHEDIIFTWEGSNLRALRRAISEELLETSIENNTFITKQSYDILRVRVIEYGWGDEDGETILFEETFDMTEDGMGEDYLTFSQREQAALWDGLQ